MLFTGYPPSVDGIANPPIVEDGTAVFNDEPPPSDALPFDTVYVQVMPSTVAGSAKDWHAQIKIAAPMQHIFFTALPSFCCIEPGARFIESHTSFSKTQLVPYRTCVCSKHHISKSFPLSSGKQSLIVLIASSNDTKFLIAPLSRNGRIPCEAIPIQPWGPNYALAFSIHPFLMIESKFNMSFLTDGIKKEQLSIGTR